MSDIIVIEPGTPAYEQIAMAVKFGRKISIQARGESQVAIKQGELTWSPTIRSEHPPYSGWPEGHPLHGK